MCHVFSQFVSTGWSSVQFTLNSILCRSEIVFKYLKANLKFYLRTETKIYENQRIDVRGPIYPIYFG